MQMGLHSMHAAALRPVMIVQPFMPRPQPRRATTAARHCTSARATADDQAPQDDQRLLTRRALGAALAAGCALSFVNVAEAAGLRMKGMPGGNGSNDEASEKYMNSIEKKKLQSSRRKEALLKRRTEALSSGGAQSDKEADPAVQAANAEVDRSNAERAADSEKLMAGIRSRAAGYGNTAGKTTGRLE
jgi:hypothetical protein